MTMVAVTIAELITTKMTKAAVKTTEHSNSRSYDDGSSNESSSGAVAMTVAKMTSVAAT